MGIWKNLRAGAAFMREYQQDAMKTVPRWARVVRVGAGCSGWSAWTWRSHYGRTPPHMESVSVSVPRGMQLQAGQDVFVVGHGYQQRQQPHDMDPRPDAATAVRTSST